MLFYQWKRSHMIVVCGFSLHCILVSLNLRVLCQLWPLNWSAAVEQMATPGEHYSAVQFIYFLNITDCSLVPEWNLSKTSEVWFRNQWLFWIWISSFLMNQKHTTQPVLSVSQMKWIDIYLTNRYLLYIHKPVLFYWIKHIPLNLLYLVVLKTWVVSNWLIVHMTTC